MFISATECSTLVLLLFILRNPLRLNGLRFKEYGQAFLNQRIFATVLQYVLLGICCSCLLSGFRFPFVNVNSS